MFKFLESHKYTMPAHFGGYEGPPTATTYHDVCSIGISYETDRDALVQYVPEAFRLKDPIISVSCAMCRACDWLSGGSYALISVDVPVAYVQGRERLEGQFALVLWENRTDPILTGRNNGMPKIPADIEDLHQLGDRVFTNVSHEGTSFLRVEFRKTDRMTMEDLAKPVHVDWFGWRYVPNIGRAGAALSHATLFPQEFAHTDGWRGIGKVAWEAGTAEQHPAQFHIIKALSELPIKRYHESSMTFGANILREDLARALG